MFNKVPRAERQAIVGVGSPHGDDCVGWSAVESLRGCVDAGVTLRAVATPLLILDNLEDVTHLVIIDAYRGGLTPGTVVHYRWPQLPKKGGMAFATSHDLSIIEVLKLAETLGRLPRNVSIVLMEIGDAAPGHKMSASVLEALPELVKKVVQEMTTTC